MILARHNGMPANTSPPDASMSPLLWIPCEISTFDDIDDHSPDRAHPATDRFSLKSTMWLRDASERARMALASAVSVLPPGSALDVIIDVIPSTVEQPAIGVNISGSAVGGTEAPDGEVGGPASSLLLADALRVAAPAYRFEPGQETSTMSGDGLAHRSVLAPRPLTIPTRSIGFVDRNEDASTERHVGGDDVGALPGTMPDATLDEILDALLSAGIATQVRLRLIGVVLTQDELARLSQPTSLVDPVEAARWRANPLGVCITCEVAAERPVPAHLLRRLASAVFGTTIVDVRPLTGAGHAVGTTSMSRKRHCRHRDHALPPLLPSPGLLLRAGTTRGFEVPRRLPQDGVPLGRALGSFGPLPVLLPDSERCQHSYVVGATGTGKSTLLRGMVASDMHRGSGLMLLDPHGDLFEEVLAAVPAERADDVVILDASDQDHPFALNVLEPGRWAPARAASFIVNELLAMFDSLYDMRQCGGPVFELYFTHAITLLVRAHPGIPTVADLPRVFEDDEWLHQLLKRCPDPETVRFWRKTALSVCGDLALTNVTPYISSKVNRLIHDAALRPIVCQRRPGIDLLEAMNQRRIVLVNLAKGRLGSQSARFLGMVMLMRLLAATLARADQPPATRAPFQVYIDEFQTVATASVGTLLAEARKFGVGVTLASQTLGQLDQRESDLGDLVAANVGSLLMTRLGPNDARRLIHHVAPYFTEADLQGLPPYHVVGRFAVRRVPTPPFVFMTEPKLETAGSTAPVEALRAASRRRWTVPLAEAFGEPDVSQHDASDSDAPAIEELDDIPF